MSFLNRIIDNPIVQNVAPYLGGAVLGGAGQQLMNLVTPSADPNPLMSAALAAPAWGNYLRGRVPENPYAQAAHMGSMAGIVGGAGASLYNTIAGGADIDNNSVAGGLALLGGLAPISYSLIKNHLKRGDEIRDMPEMNVRFSKEAPVSAQPSYSRNPSRIDLSTGAYSRNPSRIRL